MWAEVVVSGASETMGSDVQVMAQLQAVLARLEAQERRNDDLARCNEEQERRIKLLEAAATAAAAPIAVAGPAVAPADQAAPPKMGRRNLLTKALAATAAAAVLTVAKEATPASADTRTTLTAGGASTQNYGLLSSWAAGFDPQTSLPLLNGFSFGIVGVTFTNSVNPLRGAGVYGAGGGSDGVLGTSGSGAGVYAMSGTGQGVVGRSIDAMLIST